MSRLLPDLSSQSETCPSPGLEPFLYGSAASSHCVRGAYEKLFSNVAGSAYNWPPAICLYSGVSLLSRGIRLVPPRIFFLFLPVERFPIQSIL